MTAPAPQQFNPAQWRALALLALAELLGMTLWFSASAALPALRAEWHLSEADAAWLTLAVQLGFVCGTLVSALFNLADIIATRRLFALSAAAGALSSALFGLCASGFDSGVALRFCTGFFLAGVYPPGMKIMASWFRHGRGLAIGVLIGSLTLGKASPYLLNGLGAEQWRQHSFICAALALAGGLIVLLFVGDGPYALPPARFDITQITRIFGNRGVRLANLGYFGHMWELYAMWTWAPVMLRASLAAHHENAVLAELASFLVLGAGALGCVAGGLLADRVGRTVVTSAAMAASALCSLTIGFLFHAPPVLLLAVAAFWGATVVADSAQFSACVTELGEPQYIGTALTLQTCLGFLLTIASIRLIPFLVDRIGWQYAFAALAPGPVCGVIAMLRLRALPEAARIAQGRR